MQVGIDSFAAAPSDPSAGPVAAMENLLARIEHADAVGLDVFGVGEHHRKEFMDSAPHMILAAAASRTKKIRLTSAVTVLSAADPVRVFQNFATLDLLSGGRAEMVVGRGSFTEAFPLFGLQLKDYDDLFEQKLDLLLNIRNAGDTPVNWQGRFRPPLSGQPIFPRPAQEPFPIWVGVGGTPESFVRAGALGLPLMVAIIGGETHRFKPLVDLYREAGRRAGHTPEKLTVGLHSLGYLADTNQKAADEYYPGYARVFTKIGKERGWGPVSRGQFDAQIGKTGALLVGGPKEIAEKIQRHSQALGGIVRVNFQMDQADLPQEKLLSSIELLAEVKALLGA